jgi:hypothetical protein
MQGVPKALTEQEIKEIAATLYDLEKECYETVAEVEEDVKDHWAYKIEKYITDGPGYSGDLYVIVWGIPNAVTTLERAENGSLRAYCLKD